MSFLLYLWYCTFMLLIDSADPWPLTFELLRLCLHPQPMWNRISLPRPSTWSGQFHLNWGGPTTVFYCVTIWDSCQRGKTSRNLSSSENLHDWSCSSENLELSRSLHTSCSTCEVCRLNTGCEPTPSECSLIPRPIPGNETVAVLEWLFKWMPSK